jgi:hypothetical protein
MESIKSKKDLTKIIQLHKDNKLPTTYEYLKSIQNNSYKIAFLSYLLNETSLQYCSYRNAKLYLLTLSGNNWDYVNDILKQTIEIYLEKSLQS